MSENTWMITPPTTQKSAPGSSRIQPQTQGKDFASFLAKQNPGIPLNPSQPATSSVARNFVLAGRTPSDLMRMQNFSRAQSDLEQTRSLSGLMQAHTSGSTLELARSMGQARSLRSLTSQDSTVSPGIGLALGDFVHSSSHGKRKAKKVARRNGLRNDGLGTLSAQFESGKDGIAAIGYDSTGGTSYGKFQIASKVGTMKDFLQYLDSEAPDIARRLRNSGPANTGSCRGAMPDTWRAIAGEDPERFERLQEGFARETHYQPALSSIVQKTGLEEETLSPAMREVIWSTAIQHGPTGASRIFVRADGMSGSPDSPAYERNMISNVYKIRAGQFGSSTESVRAAVQNRFKKEKVLALNMLGIDGTDTIA